MAEQILYDSSPGWTITKQSLDWQQILKALLIAWTITSVYVIFKGFKARRPFAKLRAKGLPMPAWNPITGHLLALPPILKTLPLDAEQPAAFAELSKQFPDSDGSFYLDTWPFGDPLLVVTSPVQAQQAASPEHDLIKPDILVPFFAPLAGGDNLFTMNGAEWKRSRALFNPGFNANYMLSKTKEIVEETLIYLDILRTKVKAGAMFSLDEVTLWLTFDVIGIVTLNSRLQSQQGYNALASSMRSQIDWHCLHSELNPLIRWNPARPFVQWYNGWKMDNYISKELDKRYLEFRKGSNEKSRSVIDLAIEGYMAQQNGKYPDQLSPEFKKWAEVQIRLFLFAGHDSTSSTVCYSRYLLSKNPSALARIRAEHDETFGKDITQTANLLIEKPHLINQLPYTLAVVKEALRLFPPASGMRGGRADVALNNDQLPTEGMNVWLIHTAIQRNSKYWHRPDEFLPERWLVGPEDPLYPPKGGYRVFEYGPRNCIGQTLAYLDIKIVLVLTVREFDIKDAYQEWDRLHPTKAVKSVRGERAYQISQGGAHPADGFPCRISFAKR